MLQPVYGSQRTTYKSLSLLYGVLGSSSGDQAWWQAFLLTKPSCQPLCVIFYSDEKETPKISKRDLFLIVCINVYVYICAGTCLCIQKSGGRQVSSSIMLHLYSFDTDLSLNQKLTIFLLGWHPLIPSKPPVFISQPLQHRGCRYVQSCPAFRMDTRSPTQILVGKCF